MATFALKSRKVLTPQNVIEDGIVVVEDEKIKYVGRQSNIPVPEGAEVFDVGQDAVVPGFIDLHHHGALKVLASGSADDVQKISGFLPSSGCTSWLPTVNQKHLVRGIVEAYKAGTVGADIAGIHMEGPFLAPVELPGASAQDAHLKKPDIRLLHEIQEEADGLVRLVGVGIEMDGALELIREIRRLGMMASVAHTKTTYERFLEAVDAGIGHVTHAYNNMPGMHHRKPGVVGGVLTCDQVTAELISDGFHVHAPAMDVLIRCKGTDRVAVITDSSALAGVPDGRYVRPNGVAVIKKNGIARLEGFDETQDNTMAGSVWTIDHNLRTLVEKVGVSFKDAVKMASLVPARIVGIDRRKGSLECGKDADIAVVDEKFNVKMTFVRGRKVYEGAEGRK
ncbi:MAG: N-acetylglucosamine-6-phosphate deacetylase [Bacillota bacterium]